MSKKMIAGLVVGAALMTALPAFAQTTSTSTDTGSTTPGVPNTGAGGDAATNAAVLTLSGIIALGGIGYLASRRVRT